MKQLLADVAAFHLACDVPILKEPQVPPPARAELRRALIEEEVVAELLPAMQEGDLPRIADGMADAIYVIVGAALEYGIPLDRVWAAVQAANMAKVDPATGKVSKRADGKVLKPEGWTPPDIAAVLAADPAELLPDAMEELREASLMIRTWAPASFPANAYGQVHFVRAMMEAVANVIDRIVPPRPAPDAAGG